MKKKIVSMAVVSLVSLLMMVGCQSAPAPAPVTQSGEFAGAPAWVLDGGGSIEGGSAAVGSATIGKAGLGFARTEALANARDELARQVSVKVKNMVKNFTQSTGMGDDETVDRVSTQVSKQVANQTLQGSKQKETWISSSNTLYVLVVIDDNSLKNAIKNSVSTSFKNEKALWQQFQAKKAYDELDQEIEKEFGDYKQQ